MMSPSMSTGVWCDQMHTKREAITEMPRSLLYAQAPIKYQVGQELL